MFQKVAEVSDDHLKSKTLIAFDHMRFPLSYLEWGYQINNLYRVLLKNEAKHLEFKSKHV
jgi:hypothetical protein